MRRPLLVATGVLLTIAAVVMSNIASTLDTAPVSEAASPQDTTAVHKYYEAINTLLETGDPAQLKAMLHPALHDALFPGGAAGEGDDLVDYLTWLRATVPDLRLSPSAASNDGEHFLVPVAVKTDVVSMPTGIALDHSTSLWPAVEVLRVDSGQIIERGSVDPWVRPLHPIFSFDGEAVSHDEPFRAGVSRYRFPSKSRARFMTTVSPAMLHVSSGELVLSLSRASSGNALWFHERSEDGLVSPETVEPGQDGHANAGSLLVIPPKSEFSILNLSDESSEGSTLAISLESWNVAIVEPVPYPIVPDERSVQLESRLMLSISASFRIDIGVASIPAAGLLRASPESMLMAWWSNGLELLVTKDDAVCSHLDSSHSGAAEEPDAVQFLCHDRGAGALAINPGADWASMWVVSLSGEPDPPVTASI